MLTLTKASERGELLSFPEFIGILGYFGHSAPQICNFMAFLFWNIDFTLKYGMCFMNFEEGFNGILNSKAFWLDFDWRMVLLWFVYNSRPKSGGFFHLFLKFWGHGKARDPNLGLYVFIFWVTERLATQVWVATHSLKTSALAIKSNNVPINSGCV